MADDEWHDVVTAVRDAMRRHKFEVTIVRKAWDYYATARCVRCGAVEGSTGSNLEADRPTDRQAEERAVAVLKAGGWEATKAGAVCAACRTAAV